MSKKVTFHRTVTIGGVDEEIELSISELLSHVDVGDCISYFSEDSILDEINTSDIVKHFKTEELLEEIGIRDSVKHFGDADIIKELDVDLIMDSIVIPEFINHKGVDDVLDSIGTKEALCWAVQNDIITTKEVLMETLTSFYSYEKLLEIFIGAIKHKEFK